MKKEGKQLLTFLSLPLHNAKGASRRDGGADGEEGVKSWNQFLYRAYDSTSTKTLLESEGDNLVLLPVLKGKEQEDCP